MVRNNTAAPKSVAVDVATKVKELKIVSKLVESQKKAGLEESEILHSLFKSWYKDLENMSNVTDRHREQSTSRRDQRRSMGQ